MAYTDSLLDNLVTILRSDSSLLASTYFSASSITKQISRRDKKSLSGGKNLGVSPVVLISIVDTNREPLTGLDDKLDVTVELEISVPLVGRTKVEDLEDIFSLIYTALKATPNFDSPTTIPSLNNWTIGSRTDISNESATKTITLNVTLIVAEGVL